MISRIIKVEVGVITRTRRLRLITITETVIYYQVKKSSIHGLSSGIFRDGPLEKWWGVGNFQLGRIFFSLTACAGIFFSGEPLCTIFFFQTNIAFFWTVKSWFIIYVFVLYKLFYTHNRSKNTGHFSKMYTQWERRKPLGVDCFPVQNNPALWNSSPTAHHNDASKK